MDTLIDKVITQIQEDFENGDLTALEELLKNIDPTILQGYLPEQAWTAEKFEIVQE